MAALLETSLEGAPRRRGKVRDVYDLGDRLLIVATDRISAFDWVLPTGIPDKGRVLSGLSAFWFGAVSERNPFKTPELLHIAQVRALANEIRHGGQTHCAIVLASETLQRACRAVVAQAGVSLVPVTARRRPGNNPGECGTRARGRHFPAGP